MTGRGLVLLQKILNGDGNPADTRNGLPGIGQLPTHQHHEIEAEEEENQTTDAVLDADDLMVG